MLALAIIAAIMRLARSAMLEVLDSDYVKFAQVKGMSDRAVIWKHAARNALIPVITFGGISLAGLLNGSVVVEVGFRLAGRGAHAAGGRSIQQLPQVEGAIMVSGAAYILTALVVDILYGYADPRVPHELGQAPSSFPVTPSFLATFVIPAKAGIQEYHFGF